MLRDKYSAVSVWAVSYTHLQYKQEIKRPVGVRSMSVNNITINVKLGKSVDKEVNDVSIEYRNLSDEYTVQGRCV